jgi:hypothetical protein
MPWMFSQVLCYVESDCVWVNVGEIMSIVSLGASTVKWTSLDPCSGLSESDPKQYTNFKFYEIKIHKHLENI